LILEDHDLRSWIFEREILVKETFDSNDLPKIRYRPVRGVSRGRVDSIIRRIGWGISISGPVLFIVYLVLGASRKIPELYYIAANIVFFTGSGLLIIVLFWIFTIRGWLLSERELSGGYTTVYSHLVREVDVVDWKTGALIVPAGENPPTRGEFNERVRAARRAWKNRRS